MSWLSTFLLGRIGQELPLALQIVDINKNFRNAEMDQRNISGDYKRSLIKVGIPVIQVQFANATNDAISRLQGMRNRREVLNFKDRNDSGVRDQIETSVTDMSVFLTNTGVSGVTIVGVFLSSDYTKAGTNYFTGGSYNDSTREITLGSALPDDETEVIVDYNYTGHRVVVTALDVHPHQGSYKDFWLGTFELTGA